MHLNVMRRATIMLILSILLAIGLGVSEASSAELPADAVSPDETVGAAARQMLDRRVHHLIVDEPDGTIGILSSFDLLRILAPDTTG